MYSLNRAKLLLLPVCDCHLDIRKKTTSTTVARGYVYARLYLSLRIYEACGCHAP